MRPESWLSETMASVVVFLVALPLCMGVAIASGVPPAMGLVSGIVGGIVVGTLAGSPLQVSGPAAGLAVIVYDIVQAHGLVALGPIVILAGLLQAVAGKLHLGQWFRAVAPAVIYGMLAGIGVLIFASQLHVMIDDVPQSNALVNLANVPAAVMKAAAGGQHGAAALVGMLSLSLLAFWNMGRKHLPSPLSQLPAPLVAIAASVAAAWWWKPDIAFVTVPESLGALIVTPTTESMLMLLSPTVLGSAVALAVIASAESLLCAVAVDKLHDGVRTDLDQELYAQGIGNAVSGFLGGLPVTGVIVRSTANVESGATSRWAAVMHGVWLLLAVAAVPFALEWIPVASLAAVLVYIGWRLVNLDVPRSLLARGRGEFAIYVTTVGAIVVTNLLLGLMIGVVVSVLKLAWSFSHLETDLEESDDRVDLRLRGSGTFVVLPALSRALSTIPGQREVHVHLEEVDYVDHACFELLSDWRAQYEVQGGTVVLEWDVLAEAAIYRPAREAA